MDIQSLASEIITSTLNVVEASDPVRLYKGKITSTKPLEVAINDTLTISEDQLYVSSSVLNMKKHIDFTFVSAETKLNGVVKSANTVGFVEFLPEKTHTHAIKTPDGLECSVYNELRVNEEVLVAQVQKGQVYVIIDRIYPAKSYTPNRKYKPVARRED